MKRCSGCNTEFRPDGLFYMGAVGWRCPHCLIDEWARATDSDRWRTRRNSELQETVNGLRELLKKHGIEEPKSDK